jgi:hypothetical protein
MKATKQPTGTYTFGTTIPKKGATLLCDDTYTHGYHNQCPVCRKTFAQHLKPKENQ